MMTALFDVIVALCGVMVSTMAFYLIFHPGYRDRLMRRIGLSLIVLAGAARFLSILTGTGSVPSPIGGVLWMGMCLFFIDHTRSFSKRLKCKDTPAWYETETTILTRPKQ